MFIRNPAANHGLIFVVVAKHLGGEQMRLLNDSEVFSSDTC